jgi:hypothetical protein
MIAFEGNQSCRMLAGCNCLATAVQYWVSFSTVMQPCSSLYLLLLHSRVELAESGQVGSWLPSWHHCLTEGRVAQLVDRYGKGYCIGIRAAMQSRCSPHSAQRWAASPRWRITKRVGEGRVIAIKVLAGRTRSAGGFQKTGKSKLLFIYDSTVMPRCTWDVATEAGICWSLQQTASHSTLHCGLQKPLRLLQPSYRVRDRRRVRELDTGGLVKRGCWARAGIYIRPSYWLDQQ